MSSMTSSLVLIASLVLSVVSWNGVAAFTHQQSPRLASCHGSPSNTCMSMVVDSENDDSSTSSKERFKGIRYLGQGNDAIIRPGVVLVAPKHEYDHFLRKSAVFVYAIGLGENDSMIIRGEYFSLYVTCVEILCYNSLLILSMYFPKHMKVW